MTEAIERILRFNCPEGCDGKGSYPEMGVDGEWEQGQCQWCFEFGMPAREAIGNSVSMARVNEKINRAEKEIVDEGLKTIDKLKKSGAW